MTVKISLHHAISIVSITSKMAETDKGPLMTLVSPLIPCTPLHSVAERYRSEESRQNLFQFVVSFLFQRLKLQLISVFIIMFLLFIGILDRDFECKRLFRSFYLSVQLRCKCGRYNGKYQRFKIFLFLKSQWFSRNFLINHFGIGLRLCVKQGLRAKPAMARICLQVHFINQAILPFIMFLKTRTEMFIL